MGKQITYPQNNQVVTYAYDQIGVLRQVKATNTASPVNKTNRLHFTFRNRLVDPLGRVMFHTSACTGTVVPVDSLQRPCRGGGGPTEAASRCNRLGMLVSQSWTSGAIDSMRYDASGNLLKKITKPFGLSYRTQQFTMISTGAISNRLANDSTSTDPWSMEFAYTAEGSRQVENPTTSAQGQIGFWRAYFYDGLGRMSGYKYYQLNGSGG